MLLSLGAGDGVNVGWECAGELFAVVGVIVGEIGGSWLPGVLGVVKVVVVGGFGGG